MSRLAPALVALEERFGLVPLVARAGGADRGPSDGGIASIAPGLVDVVRVKVDQFVRPDLDEFGLVGDRGENDPATAVVDAVTEIRDSLGLPSRLRDLDGTSTDGVRNAAALTHEDAFMDIGPAGFDPSVDDIEAILERAW